MENKKSKIHLNLPPEPEMDTYKHAIWTLKLQLPAMKAEFEKIGKSNIEDTNTYKRRYKRGWQEYFDNYPLKEKLAAYSPEECKIWAELQQLCKEAQISSVESEKIAKLECAWMKYWELKQKQVKDRGGPHPALFPPGFKGPIIHNSAVDRATQSVETENTSNGTFEMATQTLLSYTTDLKWTKPKFSLPPIVGEENNLKTGFRVFPPEKFLKNFLENGGLSDYCSQVVAESGAERLSALKRNRLETEAENVWQNGLNSLARAQPPLEFTAYLNRSNFYQAQQLLAELHRRLCHQMTVRHSLQSKCKSNDTAENLSDEAVCSGDMSVEEMMRLRETAKQEQITDGMARAKVDMTRAQFDQLEKILCTTTVHPGTVIRKPKRKKSVHYVFFTIKDARIVELFIKQGQPPNSDPILTATKNSKTYVADISQDHPLKLRFGSISKKNCCKLSIEVHFHIQSLT